MDYRYLKDRAIKITGQLFRVKAVMELGDELSLVGWWLPETQKDPDVPYVQHVLIPKDLPIELAEKIK